MEHDVPLLPRAATAATAAAAQHAATASLVACRF